MNNRQVVLVATFALVAVTGCKMGQMFGKSANSAPDSSNGTTTANSSGSNSGNSSSNSGSDGIPTDEARIYKPMEDAADKLGLMTTTTNLDSTKRISGKIAVVNRKYVFTDDYYTELFSPFFDKFESDDELKNWGIDKTKIATKPDEIETLVRITCKKGKKIGTFRSPDKTKTVPGYGMDCDVEVIDYKAAEVFAKKSFSNNEMPATASIDDDDKDHTVLQPYREIHSYIKNFPRD